MTSILGVTATVTVTVTVGPARRDFQMRYFKFHRSESAYRDSGFRVK